MNLGDRIKRYEASYYRVATVRTPLMIRVDGRALSQPEQEPCK